MSSQDPSSSKQSKPAREKGDAPDIGRVSKFRTGGSFTGDSGPSGMTAVDDIDRRLSLAGGLGILLLLCGVVVAGLAAWAFISSKENREAGKTEKPADTVAVTEESPKAGLMRVPSSGELEEIVDKFLKARSEVELAPLIRKSDQEMPEILDKLAGLEAKDGEFHNLKYLGGMASRCLRAEGVLVNFKGGHNRLAILTPDEAGQWRIDFDGFDRYLSKPIDEIISGEAIDARVRFYVSTDSYYNGRFKDDAGWVCYGMGSPDSDKLMFGYVPAGSPQHQALKSVIATKDEARAGNTSRSRLRRMTLDIRHHVGSEARQFEILRVLSDEWAIGPIPLDEMVSKDAGK